jgi:hypothetical protein
MAPYLSDMPAAARKTPETELKLGSWERKIREDAGGADHGRVTL